MYLKRLEIQGFKSFPEKIRLEFNEGITAVVGPNGSGKSNISDAVRWVLGEQSVKSLRGVKMEDIIFSGTSNRRPLGFAEVSLVLDNSGRELALDYSEVAVTRRVYRSGESEYLINGTACRLKDVHELFMDTGIGREGYSIIGQGRIDSILSSKSEDRRMLFEEAAGIVKYKSRRGDAAQKLEKEKQNLIRVNDIIEELDRQLEPLKEQSEKARNYLKLAERLKLLQINIFLNDVDEYERERDKLLGQLEDSKNRAEEETRMLALLAEDAKAEKDWLTELEAGIEKENQAAAAAAGLQKDRENDKKLIEQEINHAEKDRQRMEAETEAKRKIIHERRQKKNLLETAKASLNLEEARLEADLSFAQAEFEKLNIKLTESEQSIEEANRRIVENMKQLSEAVTNLNRTAFINEQLQKRREELDTEVDFHESRIHDKGVRLNVIQRRYEDVNSTALSLSEKLSETNEQRDKNRADLDRLVAEEAGLRTKLNEKASRHKILTELEEGYEGYYNSVKAVLKKRKDDAAFAGIYGAVGELITMPAAYETAIEIALGGSVQHIVTKDEAAAQTAIEYLKSAKQGRATFLPVSALKAREAVKPEILREEGVIGTAKSLIKYDYAHANVISNLLERVIVIDTMPRAVAFARKYSYSFKIVTLDGELLNIGGAITGGSTTKAAGNIFSRGRDLLSLKNEMKTLEENMNRLQEALGKRREERKIMTDRLESLQTDLQEVRIELSDIKGELERETAALSGLKDKKLELEEEARELVKSRNIIAGDMELALARKKELEQEEEAIRRRLTESQSLIQEDKEIKEEKINALTSLRVSLSQTLQNRKTQEENINQAEKDIYLAEGEINELSKAKEKNEQAVVTAKEKIREAENEVIRLGEEIERKRREAAELIQKKLNSQRELSKIENSIEEKNKQISLLANEETRLMAKKENLEENNRRKYDYMWEEYEITYQAARAFERLPDKSESLQKEEKDLRAVIREMGSVNVSSIEEYRAVSERRTFLNGQREDILTAEQQLNSIISELTRLMEIQFLSQFKLISENFDTVFSEIFGGGSARLILSEEENVLESGIEIAAQPPGKLLKNMLLLSGGERALTAIALLFAILKMKPSPFCILDEIEAALDDSNVYRYADYLKRFSAETQFILITHRKGTMEAADVIYGVTMQEQGVSKLVSVKFSEDKEQTEHGNV